MKRGYIMKRILSIILVLSMLFVFAAMAACNNTDENASAPPSAEPVSQAPVSEEPDPGIDLSATKPNEYIPEKLAAGMDVLVAFLSVEFGSTTMVELDKGLKAGIESAGYKYTSDTFNIDTAVQLSMIENYVTMGAAMVITIIFDPGLQDVITNAIDAGTYIVCWGGAMPGFDISLATTRDFAHFGEVTANMMVAWVEQTYPGEVVKAGLLNNIGNEMVRSQTDAIMATLDASGVVNTVYTSNAEEQSIDSGFTFAEEALTYDKDVRLMVGFTFSQALGMSNYISSLSGVDLAEYGVFAGDTDSSAREFADQSTGANGVFRGYAAVGGDAPYEGILPFIYQLLAGEIEPGLIANEPAFCYTNFGYIFDER